MGAFKVVKLVDPIYIATSGVALGHTGGTATSGTFNLYEGNNITFTTAGNSLTIHGGAGAGGGIAAAAGTQTATSGTVKFENSNGITFGMSASTRITASHNGITLQTTQPVAAGAANGSFNFSTLSFIDSNGVSFATSTDGIRATVKTDYLTTARASNDAIGLNTAQSNVTWTVNSSGISLDARGYAGTGTSKTGGAAITLNSNGIAFDGSALAGTNTTFNGANISGSMTVNTDGVRLSMSVAPGGGGADGYNILAAGTQTANTTGTVLFDNANGITFGMANSSVITASHNALTSQSNQAASGSNGSFTFQTLSFNNANGISFGSNGSAITASHNALTTARASNDAVGLNTAQSNVTWTVNSSGISLDARGYAGTATGATNASVTANSNGISVSVGPYITTARASTDAIGLNTAQSNVTWTVNSSGLSLDARGYAGTGTSKTGGAAITLNSNGLQFNGAALAGTNTTFNGTNVSGSMTVNTDGVRIDLSAGAGGGVTPVASASNGSFSFTTLGFSNANNVTFGTSAGSIITASVAAPGAAAENNNVNLLGANTAGNTTASGSTIGYSGINLTLSGTNDSVINISAPATSQLSATGGISISTNGSTISIGLGKLVMYEPMPMLQSGSSTYAPGIGTWYIQPLIASLPINSGRINVLHSFGSTSNLFAASNGTSFATGTTGGASYSFAYSKKVALFSLGNGANSTRLESFWSTMWTLGASHSMGLSLTNASQLTGQRQLSMSYIASVGSDGGTTGAGIGATHNASFANSSTATSAYTSAMSSIYNMLSGANLMPIPFNTSISAGNYWIGEMYSTASTTAGTSINGASIWPLVNQVGFYGMASMSHRQWGKTASSTGSQYFPGKGIFSVVSASPPTTIAFSDIRSFASNQFNYYNIIQSGATV